MQQSQKLYDKSQIFDKLLYHKRKQSHDAQTDFLHQLVEERICERLDLINRDFANILVYGGAGKIISAHHKIGKTWVANSHPSNNSNLAYDDEHLPFEHNVFDAIFSLLHLHHANDLAGALIQMTNALKPDGLLLVAVAGVHSLQELRHCLSFAEMQGGGISPRIAPFMDIRDAGALMQRAHLQLPVVDDEIIRLSYENMFALMQELRMAGEANILRDRCKNFTARGLFMNAAEEYRNKFSDDDGRVKATAHLLYLTGWKAGENQQQPLQRGSGKLSMKDIF